MGNCYPKKRVARRPLVERVCQACGVTFMAKPSNVEAGGAKACSKECSYKVRKPRCDRKPRPSCVCQWCGNVFVDTTHSVRPRQYCSNKCLGLSKRKDSKSHPRRKQTAELQHWARKVILRDKVCVRCGDRDNLQAHHIKPYADNEQLRLDVGNGVALCPVCHHAQHPNHKLNFYLKRGGQTVQRCVACEVAFLPRKPTQRSCSVSCGAKLRQRRRIYEKAQKDEG